MAARPPFRDPLLNDEFAKRGFVIVPLLDEEEIADVLVGYEGLVPDGAKGHHSTIMVDDPRYRWRVSCVMRSIISPKLDRYFADYRQCFCNFMVKHPDESSALQLHLDWSLADEHYYTAVHSWCPLLDVDEDNGCLLVVPGSHRLSDPIRSYACEFPYHSISDLIRSQLLQAVPMAAGTAVLFHPALIHGSGLNRTPRPRVAAMCVNLPQEAPMLYWNRVSPEELERYEVEDDFFYHVTLAGPPPANVRLVGRDRLTVRQRSADELLAAYAASAPPGLAAATIER